MKQIKSIILGSMLFVGIQTVSFGQLLRINDFDDNGIIFKYHSDYENIIKQNKVKKATSSNLPYGSSTMYEYNLNGQISKTDRQPNHHNNGIRKYDETGRLIEKYEVQFNKIPDTVKITKYSYDEKGKINKKIVWYKNKTEYNHSDYTKSKRYTNKIEEFKYTNSYNEANQLVQQKIFLADTLFSSLLYKYDENSNLLDFKIFHKDTYINWHYTLKYDTKNRVIAIQDMVASDSIVRNIIYNDNGQVVSEFKKINYNANGLIKTISQYSENEEVNIVNEFKYEYYK